MNLLSITITLFFVVVWIMGIAWQVGYLKPLGRNLSIRGWRIHLLDPEPPASAIPQFERRSLLAKSRPLLGIALLVGLVWVLVAVALLVLSIQLRSTALLVVGMIINFAVLIFAHTRLRIRYLMRVICTTPCPKCGNLPMNHLAPSKDDRRLLVCVRCQTEWDIGPANF
jgi:hypothetical protein